MYGQTDPCGVLDSECFMWFYVDRHRLMGARYQSFCLLSLKGGLALVRLYIRPVPSSAHMDPEDPTVIALCSV